MKILVSGGAGFIGSNIADAYIALGHEVWIIDNLSTGKMENVNPKARFVNMDINDRRAGELFDSEKFDVLNHHAAQMDVRISVRDPAFDAKVNILGAINLFVAAKSNGVKKIIFASSGGAVYGEQDYFPADEEHPTFPCSPYGITKLATEKYLYYYRKEFGIPYIALRYTNIYGPRQNPHGEAGVVAIFIHKLLSDAQAYINGDGKNSRDYVFVGDVVRANCLALRPEADGIYNVSTCVEHDVNYIYNKLKWIINSSCPEIHIEAKPGEQRRSVCTYGRINEKLGWKPEINFDEGLMLTVDYFKKKFNKKSTNIHAR